MDQGILECLKKKYRSRLLQLILYTEDNKSIIEALKKSDCEGRYELNQWVLEHKTIDHLQAFGEKFLKKPQTLCLTQSRKNFKIKTKYP